MNEWTNGAKIGKQKNILLYHTNQPPQHPHHYILGQSKHVPVQRCSILALNLIAFHWCYCPSGRMKRRKGCSTFPADGHQICAWFICPVINCEKQHPTTWVRYIHENAFIKKKRAEDEKRERERLLCLKPNSTDESIKQLKLTSACYMDSINASRWSYSNSASCWWTVERRVGVPEMCCIAFEISQMHLLIKSVNSESFSLIISYSTTWVIFKFYLCNHFI